MSRSGVALPWSPESDLNEKIYYRWRPSLLADGSVASFPDSEGAIDAAQVTAGNRPTKDATGLVFSSGTKNLVVPKLTTPGRQHAFVAVFKADVANATASDGALFTFHGFSTSEPARSPALFYSRGLASYNIFRSAVDEANTAILLPKGTDTDTHVVISRVVNGVHYASIDGAAEVASISTNIVVRRDPSSTTGLIGDYNATTINWTLKDLIILQGEITDAELARIQGWAKAEYGATLAGGHEFFSTHPSRSRFVNDWAGNTLDDWNNTIDPYWDHASPETTIEQNYGETIAATIAGLSEVFRDDFTSDTVRDDDSGTVSVQNTAMWFAPVQDDVGGVVTQQKPGATPDVISQSGSELTISMQKVGGIWYTTNLVSVNRDGRGNTWNPADGPTYFEARIKSNADGEPCWLAMWLKDVREFSWRTTPRIEIDVVEAYYGDNSGHHQSLHTWPADRTYGGRISTHELQSNYTGLLAANSWPGGTVDMYDGAYHTYGIYIDDTWAIWTFDGYELMRAPTTPDMLQPLYLLFSFTRWTTSLTAGAPTMGLDWVRVLQ